VYLYHRWRELSRAAFPRLHLRLPLPGRAVIAEKGLALTTAREYESLWVEIRRVDAETMLEYAISIGAPASEHAATLREARMCQTPAPTATP